MSSPEAATKRILPAWMTKNVAEPEEWAKMRPKRRKKTALARTETVYCMNEAELVDMALCILAENCKAIEGDVISSEDKVQEHQQESIDGHFPRTAVNLAKDPPVPSTPPDQSASLSSNEETKLEEDDDDDALKYAIPCFVGKDCAPETEEIKTVCGRILWRFNALLLFTLILSSNLVYS